MGRPGRLRHADPDRRPGNARKRQDARCADQAGLRLIQLVDTGVSADGIACIEMVAPPPVKAR
jgi:hypothetical protein